MTEFNECLKVAVVADSHFDETKRFDECCAIHEWIADDIARRNVNAVLHTGDVYERKSTPTERLAVAAFVRAVTHHAPMLIVRGNHDFLEDLPLLEKLNTRHPVTVVEDARVVQMGNAAIACMAWPRKGELLARLSNVPPDQVNAVAATMMQNVLRGLGQQLDALESEGPRIFMSHAMVRASQISVGQPLMGQDFELGLEDIALVRAAAYVLGHIHLGQDWTIDEAPCIYPGSPRRTAFGELEEKGYVILEFEGNKLTNWYRVKTPCAPMVQLEARFDDEQFALTEGDYEDGKQPRAEVRFRYRVESDRREAARAAAQKIREELLAGGAAYVKLEEEVTPRFRIRAPELAQARTIEEKLLSLWRARSDLPDDARMPRLQSKARQLEDEVRNAA